MSRLWEWTFKQEVRLLFKSGVVIYFFADEISRNYDPASGALTSLKCIGKSKGFPFYARLDDISAVTTHNVPFWKRLA